MDRWSLTKVPAVRKRRIDRRDVCREIVKMMRMALESRDAEWADRYVEHARRLSMRSRVRIPRAWRYFICRGCKRALIPGVTARFRTSTGREPHLVVSCLRCGHIYRRNLALRCSRRG
jgi:ribonuclease P protein subunit RPR2